ncbi:MAG: hypothetical protein ACTS73_05765 [Arsenophonus sp. NEOnobi-MAG3]
MADDIYSHLRQDDCFFLLLIIGVTKHGPKKLVVVEDVYQESEANLNLTSQ